METETAPRPIGEIIAAALPKQPTHFSGTDLANKPIRLTDQELARLDQFATSPLPDLPLCDRESFGQCIILLNANTVKRDEGMETSEALINSIWVEVRKYPRAAINAFYRMAIRIKPGNNCAYFPKVGEWIAFLEAWQRPDRLEHARARRMVRDERQARLDDALRALRLGLMDNAAVAALPENWRTIAETQGLVQMDADGGWCARVPYAPAAAGDESTAA